MGFVMAEARIGKERCCVDKLCEIIEASCAPLGMDLPVEPRYLQLGVKSAVTRDIKNQDCHIATTGLACRSMLEHQEGNMFYQ